MTLIYVVHMSHDAFSSNLVRWTPHFKNRLWFRNPTHHQSTSLPAPCLLSLPVPFSSRMPPPQRPNYSPNDDDNVYMEDPGRTNYISQKQRQRQHRQRKVNPRFQDVQDTGKWGALGKYEFVWVLLIIFLLVVGVVVVVIVIAIQTNGNRTTPLLPLRATAAPSMSPTQGPASTPEERLVELLKGIEAIPALDGTFQGLSDDIRFYESLNVNAASPAERAARWVLLEDPAEVRVYSEANQKRLWTRFGLATLYYALGGPNWKSQNNWLSSKSFCVWSGLECNRFQTALEEVDLSNNNLEGTIPDEIAILQDLRSIFLRLNQISGTIPGTAMASLESLSVLYLNENQLTGPVPNELTETGHISKCFVPCARFCCLFSTTLRWKHLSMISLSLSHTHTLFFCFRFSLFTKE